MLDALKVRRRYEEDQATLRLRMTGIMTRPKNSSWGRDLSEKQERAERARPLELVASRIPHLRAPEEARKRDRLGVPTLPKSRVSRPGRRILRRRWQRP